MQYYIQIYLNGKDDTTVSEMREEILSTFYKCTSTDDEPQNDGCAIGPDSWCFYNRNLARGEQTPSHTKMKVKFRLDKDQLQQVKALYERPTTDEMITKCLKGRTQNCNEHLHSRIWRIYFKQRNDSKRMVDFAAATAVCNYVGYLSSDITDRLAIKFITTVEKYLNPRDAAKDIPYRRKQRNSRIRRDLEEDTSEA